MLVENLNNVFSYENGKLFWKIKSGKGYIGKEAGSDDGKGKYLRVMLNGIRTAVHRVVFAMHHGYMPDFVDHIDGDTKNNRIENLRASSKSQNGMNQGLSKANKTGCKGVYFDARKKKFGVRVRVNKKQKHFGWFDDIELAGLVASEARVKFHGQFARDL